LARRQEVTIKTERGLHFTVGSLRHKGYRTKGIDFTGELGLVKAALLYADRVELVSVGASFMGSMNRLANLSAPEKLRLMKPLIPQFKPDASEGERVDFYKLLDSIARKREKHRRLSPKEVRMLMFLEEGWRKIEKLVENTFDEWGASGFKTALQSGRLELRPFKTTSPRAILDMGFAAETGRYEAAPSADEAWDEYRNTILKTVNNSETYPLFDDLTGNVIGEAVRNGIINPTPGAQRRGRQGGLSGDLLQRLPMFERADVASVLQIRDELSEHLGAFREAVTDAAATIESASWDGARFTEEAELVFREKVEPAVELIERRVEGHKDLKELTFRYGPSFLSGTASMGAFLGGESALASLAALAAGISTAAAVRAQRKEEESQQLYFYYRARRRFGGSR